MNKIPAAFRIFGNKWLTIFKSHYLRYFLIIKAGELISTVSYDICFAIE